MARPSKAKSTESVVEPVVESVVPVVKEKKPRAKKPLETSVSVSVPVEVVQEKAVEVKVEPLALEIIQPIEEDSADAFFSLQSAEILSRLNTASNLISTIKTEYRALEKKWLRELKVAQKSSSKRKHKSGNRAPSGFVKPTLISDELANFLDKPIGTEMARTEVTKEINKYINLHDLKDKSNGRIILPDAQLQSLLKLPKDEELSFFNLQKYMSHHFPKSIKQLKANAIVNA